MLCILSVFIPTFVLNEPVRSLFMPLTLAVGFAMIASYLLSSTLVPVLSVWLVRHPGEAGHKEGLFDRILPRFAHVVEMTVERRWIVALAYLAACGLLLWLMGGRRRHGIVSGSGFRAVRAPFCAPPGCEYEVTRKFAIKILDVIDQQSHGNLAMSIGYVGLGATNTATNNILLFMRAQDDGVLRVRLREHSGVAIDELRERLRKVLPKELMPWFEKLLEQEGRSPEEAEALAGRVSFGFEPGDIVSTVMTFGSPTPVEVMVIGAERDAVRKYALQVLAKMKDVPGLRDVQLYQQLDYPTVRVDIDREKAGPQRRGGQGRCRCVLVGTSSSRYVVRNFCARSEVWR